MPQGSAKETPNLLFGSNDCWLAFLNNNTGGGQANKTAAGTETGEIVTNIVREKEKPLLCVVTG